MIRFTKEEKIVLLFLVATLFVGTGVHYYRRLNPGQTRFISFDEKKIKDFQKVNINEATKEELVKIKGIGPVLAERIISYRESYGPFKRAEDIKNVSGIGEKTYEKMAEQIIAE